MFETDSSESEQLLLPIQKRSRRGVRTDARCAHPSSAPGTAVQAITQETSNTREEEVNLRPHWLTSACSLRSLCITGSKLTSLAISVMLIAERRHGQRLAESVKDYMHGVFLIKWDGGKNDVLIVRWS
jgi:hypothetical protein